MRWPSFLARRPAPAAPCGIVVTARPDPLIRARGEIDRAIARRREARLARPAPTEAKRFARARPKVDQLIREIATTPVAF